MAVELKYNPERTSGLMDNQVRGWYVDDEDIDGIYDRLTDLKLDIKNKIKELDILIEDAQNVYDDAHIRFYDIEYSVTPDEDIDPTAYAEWQKEYNEAEEAYEEADDKLNALTDAKEYLEDLLEKID